MQGTYKAQTAQEEWHDLWTFGSGPRTTLRAKPTGIPASRNTIDALILEQVPGSHVEAYRHALRLIITQRVPLEDLQWVAEGRLLGDRR